MKNNAKLECVVQLWEKKQWGSVLLSDVKFEEDGVKHMTNTSWIIIIAGKVAIALSICFRGMGETRV